jgi:hypothetical protein
LAYRQAKQKIDEFSGWNCDLYRRSHHTLTIAARIAPVAGKKSMSAGQPAVARRQRYNVMLRCVSLTAKPAGMPLM